MLGWYSTDVTLLRCSHSTYLQSFQLWFSCWQFLVSFFVFFGKKPNKPKTKCKFLYFVLWCQFWMIFGLLSCWCFTFVALASCGVPTFLLRFDNNVFLLCSFSFFLLFSGSSQAWEKWWERRFQNIWNKFWSSFHSGLHSDGKNCWCRYCAGTLRTKQDCKLCLSSLIFPFPMFFYFFSCVCLYPSFSSFIHAFIHEWKGPRQTTAGAATERL